MKMNRYICIVIVNSWDGCTSRIDLGQRDKKQAASHFYCILIIWEGWEPLSDAGIGWGGKGWRAGWMDHTRTHSNYVISFLDCQELKNTYKDLLACIFRLLLKVGSDELVTLERAHCYVEILNKHPGHVCDIIIINFEKVHFILDELLRNGKLIDTKRLSA